MRAARRSWSSGKDSLARERKVTVGIREGNRVQILGGVNEGEKVITSGGLGLDDKAKVDHQVRRRR